MTNTVEVPVTNLRPQMIVKDIVHGDKLISDVAPSLVPNWTIIFYHHFPPQRFPNDTLIRCAGSEYEF